MPSPILLVEDLSYSYPNTGRRVLDSISFSIQQGEFVGLIGPAGAGKTTLALALTGLVPQTLGGTLDGRVQIAGKDTREESMSRLLYGEEGSALVAITFQDPESQIVGLSVEEELAFALENICLPATEIEQRIGRVLELLNLEPYRHAFPQALSGGEKQRVALGAALALKPRLLILDEPTSELDPVGKQDIFRIVETLKRDTDVTVVMIEHEVEELVKYSDRLLVLERGRLVMDGNPRDVFSRTAELEAIGIRPPEVTTLGFLLAERIGQEKRTLLTEAEAIESLAPNPAR